MTLRNISKKVINDIVKNRYATGLDAEENHGYFSAVFLAPPDELRQPVDDLIALASHNRADSKSHILALQILTCFVDILPCVREYVLKERISGLFDSVYTFHSTRHLKQKKRNKASTSRFISTVDAPDPVLHYFLRILARWKDAYESDYLEFSVFSKYISDRKCLILPKSLDDAEIPILFPLRQLYTALTASNVDGMDKITEKQEESCVSDLTDEKAESLEKSVDFLELFSDDAMSFLDATIASAYQKGRKLLVDLLSRRDPDDPSQNFPGCTVIDSPSLLRRDFPTNSDDTVNRDSFSDIACPMYTSSSGVAHQSVMITSTDYVGNANAPIELDGKNHGLVWSHSSDEDTGMDIPIPEVHPTQLSDAGDDDMEWEHFHPQDLSLPNTDSTEAKPSDTEVTKTNVVQLPETQLIATCLPDNMSTTTPFGRTRESYLQSKVARIFGLQTNATTEPDKDSAHSTPSGHSTPEAAHQQVLRASVSSTSSASEPIYEAATMPYATSLPNNDNPVAKDNIRDQRDATSDASDPSEPSNSLSGSVDLFSAMFPATSINDYEVSHSKGTNELLPSRVNSSDGIVAPLLITSSQEGASNQDAPAFLLEKTGAHSFVPASDLSLFDTTPSNSKPWVTVGSLPGDSAVKSDTLVPNNPFFSSTALSDTMDILSSADRVMAPTGVSSSLASLHTLGSTSISRSSSSFSPLEAPEDIIDLSIHQGNDDSSEYVIDLEEEASRESGAVKSEPNLKLAATQRSSPIIKSSSNLPALPAECGVCGSSDCRCTNTDAQLRSSSSTLRMLSNIAGPKIEGDRTVVEADVSEGSSSQPTDTAELIRSDLLALLFRVQKNLLPSVQKRLALIHWAKNMNWLLADIGHEDISMTIQKRKDTSIRLHGFLRDSLVNMLPIRNTGMEGLVEATMKRYLEKLMHYSTQLHSLIRDCVQVGVEVSSDAAYTQEENEFLYEIKGLRPKRDVKKKKRAAAERNADELLLSLKQPKLSTHPLPDQESNASEAVDANVEVQESAILKELKRLRDASEEAAASKLKRVRSESQPKGKAITRDSWHYLQNRPSFSPSGGYSTVRQRSVQATDEWRPGEHLTRAMNIAISQSIQKNQAAGSRNPNKK